MSEVEKQYSEEEKKGLPRIENWHAGPSWDNTEESFVMYGIVYNDSRFLDGEPIRTSILKHVSDDGVLETANTTYLLGEPYAGV